MFQSLHVKPHPSATQTFPYMRLSSRRVVPVCLRPEAFAPLVFSLSSTKSLPHRRAFRAHSTHPRSRLSKPLPGQTLTLSNFLLRQQALALYRSIIRSCHRLPDPKAREEMRKYAREEFERQREVTEVRKIRYLLSTGRVEWKRFGGMFGGQLPF